MFDGEVFGSEIVTAVKAYVDKQTAPLLARIADLEAKLAEPPATPEPDLSVIGEMIAEAVAALPAPKDGDPGKDADPEAVREIVRAEVEAAAPKAEDIAPLISEIVQAAVAELPQAKDGEPGKDIDPQTVEQMVAQAVSALPLPQDGKSVTPEEIAPLIAEEVQKAVALIPVAKDGVGLAGAVIDREGSLILTLTNGETRDLGGVIGRDADMESIARRIEELVAEIPRPKDGKDGFSLDNFDTEMKEDGRTILLKFTAGDVTEIHELCFPLVIDRGVYKAEAEYAKGDGVTWGGSFWIAQRDTSAKPETSDDWRLAVKRGRDGKNGDPGKPGEPGKKGDPGRDGRAYT